MIERFEAPVLVVPGNHDVYPWWHPIKRLRRPLARYRTHITPELTPRFEQNGVAVLGLNTAHGRTVKGGRIDADDLDAIRSYFGEADDRTFTVLVLHHHLTKIRALGRHDIARYAQDALDAAAASGVDLILCGHLHVSHIEPVEIIPGQQRIVIASAGTATSNRGRKSNRATNFYNLIRVSAERFQVEERIYRPRVHQFVAESTTTFDRSATTMPIARDDTPG
jgi:3',5'-cyclic AMP phosphodiesterase CpdA